MSSRYISFPVITDPQDLMQAAFAYMKAKNPSWEPSEGQLDTWLIEATAGEAADIGTLASKVDRIIFKSLGQYLFGIPAVSAASSTATINITATDTLGHTFPAGMQVGIRDSLNNLIPFKLVNNAVIAPGSAVVNGVLIVSAVEGSGTSGLGSIGGNVELIDINQFILTIVQATITAGGADAETDDAYDTRLSLQLQTMTPRPILARDFAILARNVAGVQRALVIDGFNPYLNMLTIDEASFETTIANYTGVNAVLAQSATFAADGANSMRLTASSAADMSAFLNNAAAKAVTPGDTLTALASFRSAVTSRNCKVGIKWLDVANATISTDYGALVADTTTGFTQGSVTATAPALAVKAAIVVFVTAPANAEVHYVDKLQLGVGNSTTWAAGASTATAQERMITFFGLDSTGAPIGAPTKAAVKAYLDGMREVNFIVNAGDATVNSIDVTTTFTVLPNYDLNDVQSRVNTAIATFLNPKYWGISPSDDPNNPFTWTNVTKVYYLELATAMNNVVGLDRILSLTIGLHGGSMAAADLTLVGTAPIPNVGTIAATGSYS